MSHRTGSSRKVAVLIALAMLFGGAEISPAAPIVQSQSFGPLSGPSDSDTLTYNLFNPSNGTLSSVVFFFTADIDETTSWTLNLDVNNGAFTASASGAAGQSNFTVGPFPFNDPSFLAKFTGVGTFAALLTYNTLCLVNSCGAGASGNLGITYDFIASTPSEVPLPAALPLFASGLSALGLLGWRRKWKQAA